MEKNENIEMITGDPKKAINKLSLPIIGSMFLIFANNIIDSIWVAGLGTEPLAALGYITPLFMILVGFGRRTPKRAAFFERSKAQRIAAKQAALGGRLRRGSNPPWSTSKNTRLLGGYFCWCKGFNSRRAPPPRAPLT